MKIEKPEGEGLFVAREVEPGHWVVEKDGVNIIPKTSLPERIALRLAEEWNKVKDGK